MPSGGAGIAAAIKFLPMIMGGAGKNTSGSSGESSAGGSGAGIGKSALSLGTGLIQNIQANKLKNQANAYMPPMVDPNQAAFLSELHQKRKSIETGSDFAAGQNALDATNAGTDEAILRGEGGNVGGTIQALLQSQRGTNDAKNNLLAQGEQQQAAYTSMYGDLQNKIAARKLQLEMYKSQQARAEWAQKQQMANQNLGAGSAGLLSGNTPSSNTGQTESTAPQGDGTTPPVDTSILSTLKNMPQGSEAGADALGGVSGIGGITNAAGM